MNEPHTSTALPAASEGISPIETIIDEIRQGHMVILVDDEVGIRELLREILEDEGYAVETAENACRRTSAWRRSDRM